MRASYEIRTALIGHAFLENVLEKFIRVLCVS